MIALALMVLAIALGGAAVLTTWAVPCRGCAYPVRAWRGPAACGWCQMMRHRLPDLDERLRDAGL